MTALTRTVRREVARERRPLIVSLIPGAEPLIEVREKGRRVAWSIPVRTLYDMLGRKAADARVASRRKRGRR